MTIIYVINNKPSQWLKYHPVTIFFHGSGIWTWVVGSAAQGSHGLPVGQPRLHHKKLNLLFQVHSGNDRVQFLQLSGSVWLPSSLRLAGDCIQALKIYIYLLIWQGLSCSMVDSLIVTLGLSYLSKDQTHISCIGRQILNHWVSREVSSFMLFKDFCLTKSDPLDTLHIDQLKTK